MFKKVWGVITTVILIIVTILFIAFHGPKIIGLTPYVVMSGSMEPQLPVGSLIYVESCDRSDIKIGDSITFKIGETVVTHQVYEINNTTNEVFTQGINNRDSYGNIQHDAKPVNFKNIIGKPKYCIPYLGYINKYISSPPGLYITIGVVLTMVLVSVIVDIGVSSGGKRLKR